MRAMILCFAFALANHVAPAKAEEGVDPDIIERLQLMLDERGLDLNAGNYCVGDFTRSGQSEYAFAATAESERTGAYFAYTGNGLVKLADFTAGADLQCVDSSKAGDLNNAIRESEGIHGHVPDTHPGHVICGFIEGTEAHCWGYDPSADAFVKVGWWVT